MPTKHTPGPWYYSPSQCLGEFIIQGSNPLGGGPILPVMGRTHNFPVHAEANARLIAAAPDMLVALQNLVEFCEMVFVKPNECDDLTAAREAIRKALGEEA